MARAGSNPVASSLERADGGPGRQEFFELMKNVTDVGTTPPAKDASLQTK